MEVPNVNSAIVFDENIERYHECAIDLHQVECAIDAVAPYDDLSHFDALFAERPSASSETSATAVDMNSVSVNFATSASLVASVAVSDGPFDPEILFEDKFDEFEIRTFTVRKIHSTVEKKYVAHRGITKNKTFLNVEIVSPRGERRLISAMGQNAIKMFEWFM